jgi:hypothetical protein
MNPKRRQNDLLIHVVDNEAIVYDKTRKEAHLLNEPVSRVWPLLDGERSVTQLAADLSVDESIVSLSVDQLASVDLLETGEALSITRRDALRRAASVAAIGLLIPAVTSIAAPMAAQAQSAGPAKKKAAQKKAAKKKAAP